MEGAGAGPLSPRRLSWWVRGGGRAEAGLGRWWGCVGPCGLLGAVGLTGRGAGEVVEALEAGASLEADVVPGAGAVVVGAEEVLDVPEVFVEGEREAAGPWALGERAVGGQALVELLDVVLEAVEELVSCLGVPVLGGAGAAEGVEEVLEDAEDGGGGLLWVAGVEEGVGEDGRLVGVAGLCRAGSHGLEELEAVPGEGVVSGRQVVAGEGGGESRQEEQERRGAVAQAGLWGCGRSHGGPVGGAGQEPGQARWRCGRALCLGCRRVAGFMWCGGFPSLAFWWQRVSGCGFQFWLVACGGVGEVRWWGGRAWGGRWRCFAGAALGAGCL